RIALVLAAVLAFSVSGFPDDTAASIGIGGLVFQHMDHTRMNREDLYISPLQVRIHFEFVNESSAPITTIVAFPLPDINQEFLYNAMIGSIEKDPVNFVGFKTVVNGEPVALKVEQRAFAGTDGRDVTAELRRVGVPLNVGIVGFDLIHKLPKVKLATLKRERLIAEDGSADWSVSTKFWWRQTFEPGKTVVINQRYEPITGSYFDYTYDPNDDLRADACPSMGTRTALKELIAALPKCKTCQETAVFHTTDYVLTTGTNWDGPIGLFHLTLDKLRPKNILSTCWSGGLKQTSPTTFESTLWNYTPRKDLKILVVTAYPIPIP
ncbi:MAG TPA: DUF4424 family protein, partial [Terriglobales bacterium]